MNYIPVISGQSLDVVFEGYSLQFTNVVILSSSDSTKTVPFCCFKPNSNKFTQISGTPYYLYDIISSNILSVTLSAIKFLGLYDLIIFNDSGFIKLSDTGYLIDPDAPKTEWVRVLTKLCKDREHREELGNNLHDITEKLFNARTQCVNRYNLYLRAMQDLGYKLS